jgi:hypothetical protein
VANLAHTLFGDDDEPWDAEVALRNSFADWVGADAARAIMKGPIAALPGGDVHGRVSLDNLWFRESNRDLEGKDLVQYWMQNLLGPMGGIAFSAGTGYDLIQEGQTFRGIEAMMPKAIKDGMKAFRYADEGAQTLRGDPIIEDFNSFELAMQAVGFSPSRMNERYDTNSAMKNYERHITDRRQSLMNAYAMAHRLGDTDARDIALKKIEAFNKKYPRIRIDRASILGSLKGRARASQRAEHGILVNPKIPEAQRVGRFGE